jgi:hypothetical protein
MAAARCLLQHPRHAMTGAPAAAQQPASARLCPQPCAMPRLQVPKRPNIWVDTDSDSEGEPDLEMTVPTNKVKLIIGPGGAKVQEIQKRSKARVQVKKSDEEMSRWGGGM